MIHPPLLALPHRLLLLLAFIAVVAGAVLRWHTLDSRPLHTDEAVQAWQTWRLLAGEGYRYDPVDRHGPWLYYGAAALERIRGGDASTFDDRHARAFVLLAGILTLAVVAITSARFLGAYESVIATLLLAVAPLAVLYHTYFVQEGWLALFTWALLWVGLRWLESPKLGFALTAGVLVGLIQATKETSILHFAALAAGWFAAFLAMPRTRARETSSDVTATVDHRTLARHALAGAAAMIGVYAAFYSGFGENPGGLADGVRTYLHQWQRSGDSVHSHPFFHYIRLLLPHSSGGVRWGEPWLLALAAAGAVVGFRRSSTPAQRAVTMFTLVLLLIYSAIPYKTPWLLLTPVIGLTSLAGVALGRLARTSRWGAAAAVVLVVITSIQLVSRARLAVERYPGDARNPYFYQQTPRTFTKLVDRLHELTAFEPTIAVVSPDHGWPLPWYLRGYNKVGYFSTPPESLESFDIVLWDSQIDPPEAWPENAIVELHGLRPNVLLTAVIRADLWRQWEQIHLPASQPVEAAP